MVAYAYAAQFPAQSDETGSDGCLPPGSGRVGGGLQQSRYLHFRFNGPVPEALVQGRERVYFEYF
jgi:hypothetical protein